MFHAVKEMTDAVTPAATVLSDRVSVTDLKALSPELIDRLVWTGSFGADAELRGTARWVVRSLAAAKGIGPASIHDLYMAMGRGETGGFTVPAINVRAMSYDTARAVIRAAVKLNAGAFIFEIARSEIGYTEQRPHEYAAIVLGGGAARGVHRPDLHPGRSRPDQRQEVQQPRAGQGARHPAGADQGRDRRRLLQHRHRHLDAGRSRQADARRAAGRERHAGRRLRRVHPQARAGTA